MLMVLAMKPRITILSATVFNDTIIMVRSRILLGISGDSNFGIKRNFDLRDWWPHKLGLLLKLVRISLKKDVNIVIQKIKRN
jgi:hypothetical protein